MFEKSVTETSTKKCFWNCL